MKPWDEGMLYYSGDSLVCQQYLLILFYCLLEPNFGLTKWVLFTLLDAKQSSWKSHSNDKGLKNFEGGDRQEETFQSSHEQCHCTGDDCFIMLATPQFFALSGHESFGVWNMLLSAQYARKKLVTHCTDQIAECIDHLRFCPLRMHEMVGKSQIQIWERLLTASCNNKSVAVSKRERER